MKKAVEITKEVLREHMAALGLEDEVETMVYPGGSDPGGWTNVGAYVCVIHEGTGLPNDYNHRDPFGWWDRLGNEVSSRLGRQVYFEWINGCVAALYPV